VRAGLPIKYYFSKCCCCSSCCVPESYEFSELDAERGAAPAGAHAQGAGARSA